MNYVVFDLEWNQAHDRAEAQRRNLPIEGEIIQIGAVKADENLRETDSMNLLIRPQYYRKMNRRISELTGITDDDLKNGSTFSDAAERFLSWCGDDAVLLTWGSDDNRLFRENMRLYGMDEARMPRVYNGQIIYDMQLTNEHRQCALKKAAEACHEIPLDVHDALNDARTALLIFRHLDMEKGIREYSAYRVGLSQTGARKENLRVTAKTVEEAILQPKLLKAECPDCGSPVRLDGWIRLSGGKFFTKGCCENGHSCFVRLVMHRLPQGERRLWVTRVLYKPTEDLERYFREHAAAVAAAAGKEEEKP